MEQETLKVTGMHCPKCDARVEKALGEIGGIDSVKADHDADTVEISYDGTPATLAAAKEAITALDFVVEG